MNKEIKVKIPTASEHDQMEKFMKSVQIMLTAVAIAQVEHQIHFVDNKFKHPTINNHFKRIRESLQEIERHFGRIVKVKDADEFSYDYTVQLHRIMSFFIGLHTEQLEDYADGLEGMIKKVTEEHENNN